VNDAWMAEKCGEDETLFLLVILNELNVYLPSRIEI